MRDLLLPLILLALVLAVPIIPFLLFGPSLEEQITGWLDASLSPGALAALIVGLLAADILLPVPSSVVSTFAGSALGFAAGTAASWLGMTAGALLAFVLARLFGRPLALWVLTLGPCWLLYRRSEPHVREAL